MLEESAGGGRGKPRMHDDAHVGNEGVVQKEVPTDNVLFRMVAVRSSQRRERGNKKEPWRLIEREKVRYCRDKGGRRKTERQKMSSKKGLWDCMSSDVRDRV